ncbi:hypothetical protein FOZ61_003231 [Perkinsus olseni]|uniref:Uncharacterized protein n=1 Tax=Perkinsus olseni TaxID=32597 RepID=A0A7J6MIQ4_PEROL|nr:hypothetical protein FOZ61_003231 [Perkinsus olseni]
MKEIPRYICSLRQDIKYPPASVSLLSRSMYQEFAYFDAQGRLNHAALEPAGVIGSSRVAEAYARPKKALPRRRLDGARFCRLNFEKSSHEVNAHLRGDPQQRRLSRVTHPLPGCLV